MRIIAEYHHGHWAAWFDSESVSASVAGNAPISVDSFEGDDWGEAMQRLLENSPFRHLTLDDFYFDLKEIRHYFVLDELVMDRVVATLADDST